MLLFQMLDIKSNSGWNALALKLVYYYRLQDYSRAIKVLFVYHIQALIKFYRRIDINRHMCFLYKLYIDH